MQALPRENLRQLQLLLQGMTALHTDTQDASTLSPPHERALARALKLANSETPDGLIPWAAQDAAEQLPTEPGQAWAWLTPCHWAMGHLHATLSDPAALALGENESRTLLAIMQPYFASDGLTLHYLNPERWLAEGELLRHLPSASLDRVMARNVDAWLPKASAAPDAGPAARTLLRLQNEMQMLLYTHPLNDLRQSRQQLPVNSFWLSATGALPAACGVAPTGITAPRHLAQAVFNEDWLAYEKAWGLLDHEAIAPLLARQRAGDTVQLTLCGEHSAQTFATSPKSLRSTITNFFAKKSVLEILKNL
ncbi:hypothetical protein AwPolaro_04120 [Polaromonas sp.]|nr:hypothetical protein AwPolaro_04120 [Polaromonas sp.]